MPARVDRRLYVPLPEEQEWPDAELGKCTGTILSAVNGTTTVGYPSGVEAAFTDEEWAKVQEIAARNPDARGNQALWTAGSRHPWSKTVKRIE